MHITTDIVNGTQRHPFIRHTIVNGGFRDCWVIGLYLIRQGMRLCILGRAALWFPVLDDIEIIEVNQDGMV